jgi:hypothetical protein
LLSVLREDGLLFQRIQRNLLIASSSSRHLHNCDIITNRNGTDGILFENVYLVTDIDGMYPIVRYSVLFAGIQKE